MTDARRAAPADAEAIRSLVEAAYARYVERLGMRPAPMNVDYAVEIAEREVWVVPREGPVAGVLVVQVEPDHLFVHNVAVDPAVQGRGLGKSLMGIAERRAEELVLRELRLLTNELMTENRAIYAHLGWEETEVRSEHGTRRVYLRKRLGDAIGAGANPRER